MWILFSATREAIHIDPGNGIPRELPMKPARAPHVPGNTDVERMNNAVRSMFSVSKADVLKREAAWKRARAKKKRGK
jgi:hypothetical protein